jgi:Transposase DDE domain
MQNIASLHADEFPALLARLPPDLDLDQLAIEHKAIQRGRKIKSGTELLRLALAHGPGGMSLRDAAGWSGMLGLGSLSNPAVKYRLDNSVDFLDAVTDHLLAARSASQALHWPGRTIRVADGTCISKPGSKGTDLRVHGVYDLGAGGFSNLELTDVKGTETLTYGAPVAGEVRIGDRNYGRAKPWHRFLQDSGGRADLIVRIKWNGFHLTAQDGSAFDLIDHLATLPNDHLPHEIDVQALVQRGVTMPIRLVILRKPPEAVEATRKTLRAQASRKQKVLDPRTLIAAEFLILGTSLSAEDYPAVEVLAAYRLRWQIELAFKRLKSLLHIDKLPARTDLGARSWLYPHLILALLCDGLIQVFLETFPSGPFRCGIPAFTVDSTESRSMGTG